MKEMSINKIWWLKSLKGQPSDRPKIFAGRNENLPVLSDSPAVFTKAAHLYVFVQTGLTLALIWSLLEFHDLKAELSQVSDG